MRAMCDSVCVLRVALGRHALGNAPESYKCKSMIFIANLVIVLNVLAIFPTGLGYS